MKGYELDSKTQIKPLYSKPNVRTRLLLNHFIYIYINKPINYIHMRTYGDVGDARLNDELAEKRQHRQIRNRLVFLAVLLIIVIIILLIVLLFILLLVVVVIFFVVL